MDIVLDLGEDYSRDTEEVVIAHSDFPVSESKKGKTFCCWTKVIGMWGDDVIRLLVISFLLALLMPPFLTEEDESGGCRVGSTPILSKWTLDIPQMASSTIHDTFEEDESGGCRVCSTPILFSSTHALIDSRHPTDIQLTSDTTGGNSKI